MYVLVACECSGIVREAFREKGHSAYSCDLKPAEDFSSWHIQCDVREVYGHFDLVIAHPDCTYLSSSGLHWNKRIPGRQDLTDRAIKFAMMFERMADKVCVENPIGCLSTKWRKPDQIIQPYQFGHDASKATCLWLKGLPKLIPTSYVQPRIVKGESLASRLRWSNQTDSGQNRLGPSPQRAADRSRTYQGIANAMAAQWG